MNQATDTIAPLSTEQQQQVIKQTQVYIKQAENLFNINSKSVEINFNLKGRSAGMYRVKRQKREIRFNSYIFSKYFEDNFATTIPHEVAHYVSDLIYGLRNIKPHGKEWKAIMFAFDADASVTANYDLTGIPQKKNTLYAYQCSCREHQLSAIRHNKIKKNRGQYYCNFCKKILQFKQKTIKAA